MFLYCASVRYVLSDQRKTHL